MQIKKREIKARLMQSAKDEFLKKGFEKASIREIVKNAGTTIGNFYNYFEGKEDIFSAIVKKTYSQIIHFVKSHSAKDEDPFILDSFNTSQARKLVSGALAILSDNFFENLILLDGMLRRHFIPRYPPYDSGFHRKAFYRAPRPYEFHIHR